MLKATTTTYEFSLEEVKKALAAELKVEPSKMSIETVIVERGDDRFAPTWKEVTGVKVTVKN